jgi:fatty-acid peroxygenase
MNVQLGMKQKRNIDSTLALITEGYQFISNRMRKYHTDIYETRLLGKKAICLKGEEAARLVYNPELFERTNAIPKRIQKTLFGEQAIQTMDGVDHLHRKQLFLSLLTPAEENRIAEIMQYYWQTKVGVWELADEIVLFDEANEVLCKTACHWAGIPLSEAEVKDRASDLSTMVESFGGVTTRYMKGKKARQRTEQWLTGLIHDVRCNKQVAIEGTSLYAIVNYKDLSDQPLNDHMAAIELINLIRPIVAISTYITFAALALYNHPKWKSRLLTKNLSYNEMFLQEVRRFYPFGPFLGAKAKANFTWKQTKFEKGELVLLDVYGTNHDNRYWKKANRFWPENFADREGSAYDFIPQGGGDAATSHRCPGEGVTKRLMKVSLDFLLNNIEYQVPKQDLRVSLVRMPTLPKSGFRMSRIKRKEEVKDL